VGKKPKKKQKQPIQHPLFGVSIRQWIALVRKNKGIDQRFLHRALFITITSLCTAPVRVFFKMKYDAKIDSQRLKHPPVFIIGHWRSGTTYLHELLSTDPQFCTTSLWDTLLPEGGLLLEPIKGFLSRFLPAERPMDAIRVAIDGPYEDEAALAVLTPWSFFHCLYFPRKAQEQYATSIHFQGLSSEQKNQWKETYLKLIKTVVFANKGKQFLSKNPANTARIITLLEMFPEGRFIHIYRSPYLVYLSTQKMRLRVLDKLALQETSKEVIETQVIQNYIQLMHGFFEQQSLIANDRFVELRYEDLIKDPIGQVQRIYKMLKLPGLENALPKMKKYLQRQKDYKTNVYTIDEKTIEHVNRNWKFTVDRWSYPPPK